MNTEPMKARKIKLSAEEEADIDALEAVQWLNEARQLLMECSAFVMPDGNGSGSVSLYNDVLAFLEKTE